MHLQPIFSNFPYYGNKEAENLFENGLCLPSGSNLTNTDRARITAVVRQIFDIKSLPESASNYVFGNHKIKDVKGGILPISLEKK